MASSVVFTLFCFVSFPDTGYRLGILNPVLSSKNKIRPSKEKKKPSVSTYKGTSQAARQATDRTTNLRGEEGSLTTPPKEVLSPTESSSSEEESSSEESEYGDEDMRPIDISTVRFGPFELIYCL